MLLSGASAGAVFIVVVFLMASVVDWLEALRGRS